MGDNGTCLEPMHKLGFGLMRLPKISDGSSEIDVDASIALADRFLEAGYRYFDTAYVYDEGDSERTFKLAVADRYPRDAFWITDKLPLWRVDEHTSMQDLLDISLVHCGVDCFDIYLLHGLDKDSYAKSEELGAWEFLSAAQENGRARHIGFSFHDTADVLERILVQHPEVEFVQLQINYADWESDEVQSRLCYETARAHGKRVLIMEPCKGGCLSVLPNDLRAKLFDASPEHSAASWAFRFVGNLDGVFCVLSGMNTLGQMDDNIWTFDNLAPLSDTERAVLDEVVAGLAARPTIPCTKCRYCVSDCPQKIDIPQIIEQVNQYSIFGNKAPCQRRYDMAVAAGGDPAECIRCGKCAERCPQHIEIPDIMEQAVETFGASTRA